jgi:hypothetical protein
MEISLRKNSELKTFRNSKYSTQEKFVKRRLKKDIK